MPGFWRRKDFILALKISRIWIGGGEKEGPTGKGEQIKERHRGKK